MQDIFENIAGMQKNIHAININGLKGRMLRLKASKKNAKREILIIYGHHSSLERMYGIAEDMSQYGNVTIPDLPGFGGMDSFYKIGMKPTLDNLADFLATFVKLRYKNKKITIIGMSLGFVISTRMLQRYPELSDKVDTIISMVGFTHHHDFILPKRIMVFYKVVTRFFSFRVTSVFFHHVILHPFILKTFYARSYNAKSKFKVLSEKDKKQAMEFEVVLWRINDVRTYMATTLIMLYLDNCNIQINLPVHHISVKDDQYFDNTVVEQHMRVVFSDFTDYRAVLPNHAPSIIATKEEAAPLAPKGIRKLLAT